MMETIALTKRQKRNSQTLHVAAAGDLDERQHQHSPVDEDQIMNLTDMADASQELQEGIVSIPKELILISLVSQEQALYNPKHENYRNTQRKDMKWMVISEHVGWTEMQCKSKWKAMRDQYCRELKRSKFNTKANVKWKYFKELDFLRPYALARNYRPRNPIPASSSDHNISSSNNNNSNNNNSFNCSSPLATSSEINSHHQSENNNAKFTTIKLESSTSDNFTGCDFSDIKTDGHLSTVLQQQTDENGWTYNNNNSNNNSRLNSHTLGVATHLLTTNHHQQNNQQQTDEALYNALVDCVGQIQQQQQQQQQQEQQNQMCHQQCSSDQQLQQQQQVQLMQQASNVSHNDEEDDDPIHTFLNIESYFEKELIALIQHEDVLYNSFHHNYRNVKLKLEVWDEIARKLKKTVKQCRLKWKALRDQFIREHKRLKYRENVESLPRWKHYDALSFLLSFIKHKAGDYDNKTLMQLPKADIDADIDDDDDQMNISSSSPLRSPLDNMKCEMTQQPQLQIPDLDSVTNNHQSTMHQQEGEHADNLCVNSASVGGYDHIDIDNYIIAESGSVVDEKNDHHDEPDQDVGDEQTSQHNFSVYNSHSANDMVGNSAGLDVSNKHAFRTASPQTVNDQHQHQQHISMPSLDLSDNSHLMNNDSLKSSSTANQTFHTTQTLTNGDNMNLDSSLDICAAAVASSLPPNVPATFEASTNTPQPVPVCSYNTANSDDDEFGAFFKAVAMKIRNAKLPPVAFTDLQIDILKVINGSLRNN